ncbi:MAG: hypothetical protein HEP71_08105 [Roseivirga sp.]|nr:hypothetical protein [Roseivirga sp.]
MTSSSIAPSFGELEGLIGTWKGVKGWSLISVPAPGETGFKLIVQNYTEILTFKAVDAAVENKGGDLIQNIGALEYEQRIHDFDTKELIHVENGMFLYMNDIKTDSGELISPPYRVARSGTIPHGNSILILGSVDHSQGEPTIGKISSLPSEEDRQGAPKGFFSQFNSEQQRLTVQDIVIKEPSKIFDVFNPNDNLIRDNKGLEVLDSTHIALSSENEGSVDNIPFIKTHANATSAYSDFWLETVKLPMSGENFQQLQYSQNVGIEFHRKFNGKPGLITWPHITINTLAKVD